MSFSAFNPELWLHILHFLSPTVPKPLSGLTKQECLVEPADIVQSLPNAGDPGVTSRKDIRSPELARLMRTSVAFNQLASIPLYTTIISDDTPALLRGFGRPSSHPLVASKTKLLSRATSLHLEYSEKGTQPLYTALLRQGIFWANVGEPSERNITLAELIEEVSDIIEVLRPLVHSLTKRVLPFPKLTRLTFGAVFGGQEGSWDRIIPCTHTTKETGSSVEETGRAFFEESQRLVVALFRRSPLVHFCQRGHSGPLSVPLTYDWWKGLRTQRTPPLFTIHYNTNHLCNRMPAAVGNPTQWILDYPHLSANHFGHVRKIVQHSANHFKEQLSSVRSADDPMTRPAFDITVYGTTSGEPSLVTPARMTSAPNLELESEPELAYLAGLLSGGERREEALRTGVWEDSRNFVWRSSSDTPRCGACGWTCE